MTHSTVAMRGADAIQAEARAGRLAFLLDKSTIYAKIIGDRMERQQIEKARAEKRAATRKGNKDKQAVVAPTRESSRKKGKEDKAVEEDKTVSGKRKRKSDAGRDGKKVKLEEEVCLGLRALLIQGRNRSQGRRGRSAKRPCGRGRARGSRTIHFRSARAHHRCQVARLPACWCAVDDLAIREWSERYSSGRDGFGQGESPKTTATDFPDIADNILSRPSPIERHLGPVSHRLPSFRSEQLGDRV